MIVRNSEEILMNVHWLVRICATGVNSGVFRLRVWKRNSTNYLLLKQSSD